MSRRSRPDHRITAIAPFVLARDRRGVAALELALLAPAVLLLIMGIVDVGQLTYTAMQVRAAAHAGAQYVYKNAAGACPTATSIASAVQSATPLTVSATPSPSCVAACVTNNALVTVTAATKTCPSGDAPGQYATISASGAYTPIAPWTRLALPTTVTANSTIRYQ